MRVIGRVPFSRFEEDGAGGWFCDGGSIEESEGKGGGGEIESFDTFVIGGKTVSEGKDGGRSEALVLYSWEGEESG